jgi:hypothetical protein
VASRSYTVHQAVATVRAAKLHITFISAPLSKNGCM